MTRLIVSLLQWQITRFSNESSFTHIFYNLSLFTTLMTTARWYVLRTEWNVYYMSQDREWNIYYMSEITKIWAETRSSLNIWSWIERVCLNDKNSESATRANNDWSCCQAHHSKWVCYNDKVDSWSFDWACHWTEQALLNAVNMNRTSSTTCM